MNFIDRLDTDEAFRREQFPVAAADRIFLSHAAIAVLPKVAIDAMNTFNIVSGTGELDYSDLLLDQMDAVRESCASLIGAKSNEIALLGPTSLGLSLVAQGLEWRPGDEIIAYLEDYPANVYPWSDLERLGVRTVFLEPESPGEITPELVEAAMTDRTRLVALASCNFLSGYRIYFDAIGQLAHAGGALFCLDAIQTVGAFPTTVEHVDFLSADSHKWMLGPMTAGIFYVAEEHFETLRPALLGAWNVQSPNFVAQESIAFEPGGRRYEPGVLNVSGLVGMKASIDLLQEIGIDRVASRILELKSQFVVGLRERGFEIVPPEEGTWASGITTFTHSARARIPDYYRHLLDHGVIPSFRHDRAGIPYLRFSPHFYNTIAEIERVFELMDQCGHQA